MTVAGRVWAEPGRRSLHQLVERVRAQDRVREERAGAERVGVRGVEDHALGPAQREHRVADLAQRRALAFADAELARELGVADRLGLLAGLEREAHAQDEPAARVALEDARAVVKQARLDVERVDLPGRAVERSDAHEDVGDLLAVRADVLDRRRADGSGDARQRLDPGDAVRDAELHERVPVLAGGDVKPDPAVAALRLLDAARQHAHDRAVESFVRHDDVAAARQHEHRLPGRVRLADERDELVLGRGLDEAPRRTAEAQGRQLAEGRRIGHRGGRLFGGSASPRVARPEVEDPASRRGCSAVGRARGPRAEDGGSRVAARLFGGRASPRPARARMEDRPSRAGSPGEMPKTLSMPFLASRRSRAAFAIASVLVVFGAFGLWLRSSSLVRVKQVTVTGIEGQQAGAIRDALTVAARDMTTLAVDDDALRDAVATYPVVRSLEASSDFPHRLRIAVNAYEPVAAVRIGGGAPTAVVERRHAPARHDDEAPAVDLTEVAAGRRSRRRRRGAARDRARVGRTHAAARARGARLPRPPWSRGHHAERAEALLRRERAPACEVVGGGARARGRDGAGRDVRGRAHPRATRRRRLPATSGPKLSLYSRLRQPKPHFSCTRRESRILQAKLRE